MTVTFGDVVFDTVEYDEESDILVLRVGGWGRSGDDWDATEEGHPLTFLDGQIIGVDILDPMVIAEGVGEIILTLEDGTVLRSPDVLQAIPGLAAA